MALESMFEMLKRCLAPNQSPTLPEQSRERGLQIATAAILLDVAYADDSMSSTEEQKLIGSLKERFGLDDATVTELLEAAEDTRQNTIDHFAVTNLLRKNMTLDERIAIVRSMWQIVYADGDFHKDENYLVRKLADLLGLEHHVMIEAKLAARGQG